MLIKKNIFLSIFLFFAFAFNSAYAIDDKEFENASDCGVENNIVEFFSWDICEQDFAFRVFYKLFPDVLDEQVLPIVNAKYLSKVKELESDNLEINRAYQYSLLKVTEIILALSMTFGIWVFLWHASLALLRTATEGSFLGKDYNGTKTVIKYAMVAFFLIPVGNGLIVAHWLVFVLILFSIALGNLFYGIFLNYIDAGDDTANLNAENKTFTETDAERTQKYDEYIQANTNDHNFFYATELTKKIVKANVCKVRTEQFILETNMTTINSGNDTEYYKCSAESVLSSQLLNSAVTGSSFIDSGAFTSYKVRETNITNGGEKVSFTSGVRFGKNLQNNSCQNMVGIYSYSCGELSVNVPNITDDNVVQIMNKVGFYSAYAAASSAIMSNYGASSADVSGSATSGWNDLSTKLVNELATNINGEKKLKPSDEVIIKNISYVYHQLLMNDAMIGAASMSSGSLIAPSSNNPMKEKLTNSSEIAKTIIDNYCISNQEMIKKTKNLIKYVGSYKESDKTDISSSCLAMSRGKPSEFMGIVFDQDKAGVMAGRTEMKQKTTEAQEKLLEMVKDIKNKREGIELSLFKSLKSVSTVSMTAQMRKVGFASAGGFMLKIIKEKDIDNKFMKSLQNSISYADDGVDDRFIGKESVASQTNASSSINNPNFDQMSYFYNMVVGTLITTRKDLRMTDISPMISSVYDDSLSEASKSDEFASTIMEFVSNPLGNFKTAIGIGAGDDLYEDVVKKCIADLKECPIPLENPIKGLSDFGHNLISASANLIATSMMFTFVKYLKEKRIASKLAKDKGGSIEKADKAVQGVISKLGKGAKVIGFAIDMTEFVLAALIDVMLLLILVGIFFAYLIPLVPFMMFTFAFLSWITICLLTLFIIPMWVVFNLRMTEERNGNSEMYLSGYNIGMQILLRPALLIVALVMGWGLFVISFLILNLTIIPFMYGVLMTDGGSFSLIGLMNNIMLIIIYGIIVYMLIKYVFSFMYSITNKLFQAMNVTPIDDKANIAEQVMRSAVLASVMNFRAVKGINSTVRDHMNKDMKDSKAESDRNNRNDEVDLIIKDKLENRYVDDKPDTKD